MSATWDERAAPALPGLDVVSQPVTLRLPFVVPPVTSNQARNSVAAHWSVQSRAKNLVAEAVLVLVRQHRVPMLERVRITLTWFAPDHRRRDPDSLSPMLKACIDALTPPRAASPKGAPTKSGGKRKQAQAAKIGAGIIADDHAGIVESVTMRVVLGDPDPRIELLIEPLPPASQVRRR